MNTTLLSHLALGGLGAPWTYPGPIDHPHSPILAGKLIPVEICRFSLWIKTAACAKQLTSLDHTIREGNSVTSGPAVQPKAFDWQAAFPELASTAEGEPAAKRRKRRKEGKPQPRSKQP